jgi:ATPase involved in DNA replication initiation
VSNFSRLTNSHHPDDFNLDILGSDLDLFRWFLLVFLIGKPIQSLVAVRTWQLLVERQLDTPWALLEIERTRLVRLLDEGKYTRYDEKTATALRTCAQQLIDWYDGSLMLLVESSIDEDECAQRLQKLYGVGPKTAEIFLRGTEEIFAKRVE